MPEKVRLTEKKLLNNIFIILLLGVFSIIASEKIISIKDLKMPLSLMALVIAAFYIVHFLLERWKVKGDMFLFPLTAMLSACGLMMVMRLSPDFAIKQFIWLFVGLALYLLMIKIPDYRSLEDYKYIYIFAGILLLLATILFGIQVGGARSWINFGFLRFQPSEIVKIIMVIFLASYLEEKKEILSEGTNNYFGITLPNIQYIGPLLVMWGFSLVLLIFQKDLGAALIFFGTFLAMIFVATGRWSYIITGLFLFSLGAVGCYFLFNHVRVRVAIWLNPWSDIDGKGYQIVQSLFAIGSGGLFGTGLGQGNPDLIPAVRTDFIFSAWSEELGLLGAVGMIIIYCLIIYRGFRVALKAKSGFGSLLASGLTSLLAIQTIVIIGGVTKLFPLTGVTLPFVSYGGSSLVSSYILLGLLANISAKDGKSA